MDLETKDLETQEAMELHTQIMATGQELAVTLVGFSRRLKEMRDRRLYLKLGCKSFEAYVEDKVGLRVRQAYNYISTYERLGPTLMENHAGLGITKLQLLSQLSGADRDEAAAAMEGMSVSQAQELMKKLNDQGEQLSLYADQLNEAKQDAVDWEQKYRALKADQAAGHAKAEQRALKQAAADFEKKLTAAQNAQKKAEQAETAARREAAQARRESDAAAAKAREEGFEQGRVQAEIDRKKAEKLAAERQKELQLNADRDAAEFLVLFEQIQEMYRKMQAVLQRMHGSGRSEEAAKLASALSKAMAAMSGR